MPLSPRDTLKNVLSGLFENWAMMFTDIQEDVLDINDYDGVLHAQVGFEGPHKGKLDLWVTDNLSASLVANVLGMMDQDAVNEVDKEDVVKELVNMACGHFLTTYYGCEAEFKLGIPTVESDVAPPPGLAQRVNISVDGIQIVADAQVD